MKFFERLRKRLRYLGETQEDKVLLTIGERQGPRSMGDLVEQTGFGPGALLQILTRLEGRGLIQALHHPYWQLTPHGIDRINLLRLNTERPRAAYGGRKWE